MGAGRHPAGAPAAASANGRGGGGGGAACSGTLSAAALPCYASISSVRAHRCARASAPYCAALPQLPLRRRGPLMLPLCPCPACSTVSKVVGAKAAPAVVTLSFIAFWYALNIAFNLQVGAGGAGAAAGFCTAGWAYVRRLSVIFANGGSRRSQHCCGKLRQQPAAMAAVVWCSWPRKHGTAQEAAAAAAAAPLLEQQGPWRSQLTRLLRCSAVGD